jgi:hypothetical protein
MDPARGVNQGHFATYWQKWGKSHDRWKPLSKRNPRVGDAVVYGDYPSDFSHIGVVVDVKYNRHGKAVKVRTVEGNVSDKVSDLGWRKIADLTARGGAVKASGFVSPF